MDQSANTSLEGFEASLRAEQMPLGLSAPLRALWWVGRGDWQAAHDEVEAEATRDAAWVHAHLHRREGDLGNAGYWYRRAGREPGEDDLDGEWRSMVGELIIKRTEEEVR
ncbi:hypothetical protein [Halotalea alkalilenta]|nr:hypothetical protein [Halotalea alkalilenta]